MSTGEGWNMIMHACSMDMNVRNECDSAPTYQKYVANNHVTVGCGFQTGAYIYFISFTMLVAQIFLNLFIAIILESFDKTNEKDDQWMNEEVVGGFSKVWQEFDPQGKGYIPVEDFDKLIVRLVETGSTLVRGYEDKLEDERIRAKMMVNFDIPCYKDFTKYKY
jgi:hypothetical protein